jgi:hypothetical protein
MAALPALYVPVVGVSRGVGATLPASREQVFH